MSDKAMTDREVYPAVSIVTAGLAVMWAVWRYLLGAPTISGCWIWSHWHIYCPGCGGTRALLALFRGQLLRAFLLHPAVPAVAIGGVGYWLSQTVWRLRRCRGWVLRYDPRWPAMGLGLALLHCAVRNLLWFLFAIPL